MEKVISFFIWLAGPLGDIAEFGIKALIIVVAFIICAGFLKKINSSRSEKKKLKVDNLKKQYEKYKTQFYQKTLPPKEFKNYLKELDLNETSEKKKFFQFKKKDTKKQEDIKKLPRLFVLSFKGDIMASEVASLREEISIILNLANKEDEVVLLLDSRGGSVSHYGLAANQLQRLRDKNITLTACVDKTAASGGYLMACVANQILASPFAFIGSIGVIYGVPNVHEFLKKYDISYEEFTAGKYKRTVTPLGEVTEEKRQRLKEQLELVHAQFKNFVKKYRNINLEEVSTGEVWLAESALKKGLIDKLQCSDDYILEKIQSHEVYKISLKKTPNPIEKLLGKKKNFSSQLIEDFVQTDFIM